VGKKVRRREENGVGQGKAPEHQGGGLLTKIPFYEKDQNLATDLQLRQTVEEDETLAKRLSQITET